MPEIGRDDFDHYAKGERRVCQGKLCTSNVQTEKNYAVKVCHHEDCQETNEGNPLMLCMRCDEVHHLGNGINHARFDVPERPSTNLFRTPSSHSAGSDSGNEDDLDSSPKVDKKTRGYSSGKRMFKLSTAAKKKPRRHNTEDPGREFFSIKFHDNIAGDFQVEIVPALKGKSLRESLEPIFEAREFSFTTHSVFLDSSNTPLPLAFDTFPLGGNVLHVRANEDVKVDERVINIVRHSYVEDKNTTEEHNPLRPKSASFMSRSGSFTTKSKDKDKAAAKKQELDDKEKEKELQQLKNSQRGKKNIMSFLGDDPCGVQPSVSSPVLPGGVHISGAGTLPRAKSSGGRLTGLFNQPKPLKDGTLRGTLRDSLDRYTLYGLEETAGECSCIDDIEHEIKLEVSWTDIVDNSRIETMTKKQKDQQEAIWELLSTEAAYISKLYVIKKLFLQCLRNLQSEGFLVDIDAAKLFSNVEDICEVNLAFWTDYLSRVVENARQSQDLLNPLDMEKGFFMFETQFDPYIKYCMEEATCLKYFKEKLLENEDFRAYIMWCEEHHQCTDRLKLNDLLVKPMQRVTKYPLLMKAVYSKTLDEDTKEHIVIMRDKVEGFVGKVNGAMRVKHELEKLKATADRINDSYNVVEAVSEEMEKMLQDYSSYDLLRPMPGMSSDEHRCVIHEGPLRLLEKQGKMDVYVFLFTDLLLITKAKKGDKFKVIKPPLQVDKLMVSASKDQGTFLLIYLNEYNIAVQAFALQGTIADQSQWTDAIKKAQKMFMIAKLGQGSPSMFQMRLGSESDLLSPSGLVTPLGLSPTTSRMKRRSSSASSILSIESDSDEESGINFPNTISRVRSDSVRTSASSTQSLEKDRGKDGETEVAGRSALPRRKISQPELRSPDSELFQNGAIARLRSDSLTKISRSSSAPQHERPRVETVSLSRSSSDPQGPVRQRGVGLREGIIMKRRTVEEEEASLTSSSISLEDSTGDSEIQSLMQSFVDFPSLPAQESQQNKSTSEPCLNSSELNTQEQGLSPTIPDSPDSTSITENVASDSTSQTGSETPEMREEVNWDASPTNSQVFESDTELAAEANSPPPETGQTPGFQALQNLSESLESTLKTNGPTRQPPRIKSHLIGQQKIQSATEAPRKRTSLPRRSSPVVSRKSRPENLVRNREKHEQDFTDILKKIQAASAESADVNENLGQKLNKRASEPVRLPLKPDKSHYPVGADRLELISKDNGRKERAASPSEGGSSLSVVTRKKSMSLSDLLSIGRDLTGSRDKNKDKEAGKDKTSPKGMEQASSTQGLDAISPTSPDGPDKQEEKKQSVFGRLRRKSSKSGDMKEGIASGPNIDPKKATRHFFKESLMLESSEYV